MDTFKKVILSMCFSIFAIFSLGVVHADGPLYSIDKININCKIESDGAVKLTRTVTYNFDDDAHGLIYQQELPKENSNYVIQKVEVKDEGGNFKQVTQSDSHNNNTFSVSEGDGSDTFKIKTYHQIESDEQVTIKYVFTMDDAVTNYQDAARLNYKIIGYNTNVSQKNVDITFDFGKKKLKFLKAWVHADANLKKQVSTHDGTLHINIRKLPANSAVEADILFPKSVTYQNENVSKKKIISSTIKLEKKIAYESRVRWFKKYVLIPLVIICYAVIRLVINKRKIRKYNVLSMPEIPHNFDIPDISVGMADAMIAKNDLKTIFGDSISESHAFTGELLQLHNQKKILIKDQDNDYMISVIDKEIVEKDNIFDILFNTVGNGNQFTLKQLNQLIKKKDQKFSKKITKALENWFEIYTDQVGKEDINEKANQLFVNNDCYLIITGLILGIWFLCNQCWSIFFLALITLSIVIATLLIYHNMLPFNKKGLDDYLKVAGFKKMLLDIGNFKKSKLDDLILWKDILPFAVGFEIAKEVLSKLNESFSEAEIKQMYDPDEYFYFYDDNGFDVTFSMDFDSFSTIASDKSSSNGTGSSFNSGDSGGFGGNSGDGAF